MLAIIGALHPVIYQAQCSDFDHVIISRQEICIFKMAAFVEEPRNNFRLCLKKKRHVFVDKMKMLQENTKMMHRYSLNVNNMMYLVEITLVLSIKN